MLCVSAEPELWLLSLCTREERQVQGCSVAFPEHLAWAVALGTALEHSAEEESVADFPPVYTCVRNLSCLCLALGDAEAALVRDKQRRSMRIMRNRVGS